MLPVSHSLRVIRPFRSTCTRLHEASTLWRSTAVSMNFRATLNAAGDGFTAFSFLISVAGVVERVPTNALLVPRSNTIDTNAITPARKTMELPIRRRRCALGELKKRPAAEAWGVGDAMTS